RLGAAAPGGPISKAHARGCVAAAAATEGVLGIDLEYRQPGRDIGAIARWLMGAPARDELSAYRVFTYREAYFKATGDWPEARVLRFVAESDWRSFQTPDGLNVLFEREGEAFVLTLVWSASCGASRLAL
ncbi:MAG TPA: 4'-phosphopantetheinyl transferase superfamily protein, partial [Terricaulis sp.]|nr:4'-phosphopantetheinyl transferase superfamily protein [Terricaulis sp.]